MKKCIRGGARVNFFSAPDRINEDLSDIFCEMLKQKLQFIKTGGPREYANGITMHEPDKYFLNVTGTMSTTETDFYPLDISVTSEAVAEYYHSGDIQALKPQIEKLVASHARNYNDTFQTFGGLDVLAGRHLTKETPILLIGPADTITGGPPKLGYLFLQGRSDEGYRLESECSFRFTTAERR